ncbi:MAG: putative primase/helicase [Blastocatellia bacterium]|jgi:hypothetical protein|nr:putative primase/helicase [Blastocatellia bacterium]
MSGHQSSWNDKYAAQRRRDHANIEAMQNLIIQRITEETGIMMPPKARAFISGLQSAHGGGKVAGAPFTRSHLSIAQYLQFTGTETARAARVRRLLKDLLDYQEQTGFELFRVKRGGELVTAEDGSQKHTATEYTDKLKPVADAAVMLARESELWLKHPGMAMDAQVEWAMSQLVRFDPRAEDEGKAQMDLRDYANSQQGRLEKSARKVAEQIVTRGGNGAVWLRTVAKRLLQEAEAVGTASGVTNLLPRDTGESAEETPDVLAAALDYINYDDVPVFPVKPDKAPYTPNGFKDATRDQAIVRQHWQKLPDAGIGIPTGEASGFLVLDIDPRHGGDVSLTALIEEHGDEWLETMQARTGGGGHHIIFAYPRGSNIRNSANRLGEGIDVRGEGGYIIAAPSLHASGRRYEWLTNFKPAPPPEWLLKLLTEERGASTQKTQPRAKSGAGIGALIPEGERNEALFKIGCSLRGQGHNRDEIEAELMDINARRCSPPLPDVEVQKIARSAASYAPNRVAVGA